MEAGSPVAKVSVLQVIGYACSRRPGSREVGVDDVPPERTNPDVS